MRNNIFDVTNTHQGAVNISPYTELCWEQSFVCNIVYADPEGGIGANGQFIPGGSLDRRMYTFDQSASQGWDKPVLKEMHHNLYWNTGGRCMVSRDNSDPSQDLCWEEFTAKTGLDRYSRIADPGFVDPVHRRYKLKQDSPAHQLGFRDIDTDSIGLMRGEKE